MATIQKGILGGFSGKVGTVVGANWRGLDIIRSLPKKTDREPTEQQLQQRLKFALIAHFIFPIKPVVGTYFGQRQGDKSKMNLALSYHIREAVAGTYPEFNINFDRVIISKGELLGAENPTATPQADAKIKLDWTDNSGQGEAKASDWLVTVVYNMPKQLFDYRLQAATRSEATATIELPDNWAGDMLQCWITFASTDKKLYANSNYLGSIVLP